MLPIRLICPRFSQLRPFSTYYGLWDKKRKAGRPPKQHQSEDDLPTIPTVKPKHRADPKNEFAFKSLFGTNPNVLLGFLNDVLSYPQPIKALEYVNPSLSPAFKKHKQCRLDLLCTLEDDTWIGIEVQLLRELDYIDRVLHYACRLYSSQLQAKSEYQYAQAVVIISICDFNVFDDSMVKSCISDHRIIHTDSGEVSMPQLRFVFLELPKYSKKLEVPSDFWLMFFTRAHELKQNEIDELNLPEKNPILAKAIQSLEYFTWPERDRKLYDREEAKTTKIKRSLESGIKIGEEIGKKIGEEIGKKIGEEIGKKIGEEIGRKKILRLSVEEFVALKEKTDENGSH